MYKSKYVLFWEKKRFSHLLPPVAAWFSPYCVNFVTLIVMMIVYFCSRKQITQ